MTNLENNITKALYFMYYCYALYMYMESYLKTMWKNKNVKNILSWMDDNYKVVSGKGLINRINNVCDTDQNKTGYSCKDANDAEIVYSYYVAMNRIYNSGEYMLALNMQPMGNRDKDKIIEYYNNIAYMYIDFIKKRNSGESLVEALNDAENIFDDGKLESDKVKNNILYDIIGWFNSSQEYLIKIYNITNNERIKNSIYSIFDNLKLTDSLINSKSIKQLQYPEIIGKQSKAQTSSQQSKAAETPTHYNFQYPKPEGQTKNNKSIGLMQKLSIMSLKTYLKNIIINIDPMNKAQKEFSDADSKLSYQEKIAVQGIMSYTKSSEFQQAIEKARSSINADKIHLQGCMDSFNDETKCVKYTSSIHMAEVKIKIATLRKRYLEYANYVMNLTDTVKAVLKNKDIEIKFGKQITNKIMNFFDEKKKGIGSVLQDKELCIELYNTLSSDDETETFQGLPMMRRRYRY